MRYENQNPQVSYLLKKIEEQNRTIERKERFRAQRNSLFKLLYGEGGYVAQIREFSELPWYKKMFYKFKI